MKCERVELKARKILGVRSVVAVGDLMEFFPSAYDLLAADMDDHGIEAAGPPVALYRGPVGDTADVTVGFPVAQMATPRSGSIIVTLPGGPAVETIHTGPYDSLKETHVGVLSWLEEQKLTPTGDAWEEYLVGPGDDPDPAAWRTRVVYPLA